MVAGAYGKGNKQALMLDELVGCVEDIGKVLLKLYMEKDPQNKVKSVIIITNNY